MLNLAGGGLRGKISLSARDARKDHISTKTDWGVRGEQKRCAALGIVTFYGKRVR